MVEQFVSQLRRLLAEGDGNRTEIVTHERGYELRHACGVAGRRLTRADWHAALPGRTYEPAC
jgi:hypothetical protein